MLSDYNVIYKNSKNCDGSLLDIVFKKETHIAENNLYEPFFGLVDKSHYIPGKGNFYRSKIFSGNVACRESVLMAPIDINSALSVMAKVQIDQVLKNDQSLDSVKKGDVAFIKFSNVRHKGRRYPDFETNKTTCLIDSNCNIEMGMMLQIEVPEQDIQNIHWMSTVMIIWFGRSIPTHVLNIDVEKNCIDICIIPKYKKFVMAKFREEYLFKSFMLKSEDHFVPGNLAQIGDPKHFHFQIHENDKNQEIIHSILRKYLDIKKIRYDFEQNVFSIRTKQNPIMTVSTIKKFLDYRLQELFCNIVLEKNTNSIYFDESYDGFDDTLDLNSEMYSKFAFDLQFHYSTE